MSISALALMTCAVLSATPKPTLYGSPHPVPHSGGAGYCYFAASHEHDYGPESSADFHGHGDHWVFVGDPSSVGGYKGPLFRYQDAHPVPHDVSFAPVDEPFQAECKRAGMHQHAWEPVPGAPFTFRGGVFRFNADKSAAQHATADVSAHTKQKTTLEWGEVAKKAPVDVTGGVREQRTAPLRQSPADARVAVSARVFEPASTHRMVKHKKAKKPAKHHRKHQRRQHDDDDDDREEDDDEDDDD